MTAPKGPTKPRAKKNKRAAGGNDASKPGVWQKGGPSPNPNGRTPTPKEEREAFLSWAPEARAVLTQMMLNKRLAPETRLRAAMAVLDRGLGRPPQPITGDDGGPIAVTSVEIAHILGKIEALAKTPEE